MTGKYLLTNAYLSVIEKYEIIGSWQLQIWDQGKRYDFFQGIENVTPTAMTTDIEVLKKVVLDDAIDVPTMANFFEVSDIEGIDALTPGIRASYCPQNFVPIPPFFLEIIQQTISTLNGDTKVVLLKIFKSIEQFDANDNSYVDKAKTKCLSILQWLYLLVVENKAVQGIPVICCLSEKILTELIKITSRELSAESEVSTSISNQVEQYFKRPFKALVASSLLTSDFMEKLTQLQSQRSTRRTLLEL